MPPPKSTAKKRNNPEWARAPFRRSLDYLEMESRLVHLAVHGIENLVHQEAVAEALHGVSDLLTHDPAESQKRLEAARRQAALARAEVNSGFRLLHAHSIISLWGLLESLVAEVVRTWLTHRPSLMKSEALASIKVPLAEFAAMRHQERIERLLARPPASPGVAGGYPRLEDQLKLVQLDGPLPDTLKPRLIEVYQFRNLYAHCAGIVDKRALEVCPWRTDWHVGQAAPIDGQRWHEYLGALSSYIEELIYRSADKFGLRAVAERGAKRRSEALQLGAYPPSGNAPPPAAPD